MDIATRNTPPAAAARQPGASSAALAGLALCMLLPALGTSIANVALPALAQVFDAPFQQVQWVVLAYLLATTMLVVGAGRLGDILGRRRLLLAGIALFSVASALGGLAGSLWMLVAARAAQGLGAAAMLALAMALVGDAVPKDRAGSAMGLLGTLSAAGTALGPTLGGLLLAGIGWQAVFFVHVPLGVLALWLVQRSLPVDRPPAPAARRARLDLPGTLVLALTLAAYALAMTLGRGRFGWANVVLLAASAVGMAVFVRVERQAAFPLVRLASLRDPGLGAGLAKSALVSTVVMATLVVGPFYLALGLGLGAAWVGAVMSVGPLVAAVAGVPSGRLVDRFGAQPMVRAGLVGMVAGSVALCLAPAWLGVAAYALPLAVVTAGYALFQAANNTAVMADVPADRRGAVSGLLSLSRNLGLVTGASAMGAVFAWATGAQDLTMAQPQQVATGMRSTFAVSTALLVIAIAVGWSGRTRSARA